MLFILIREKMVDEKPRIFSHYKTTSRILNYNLASSVMFALRVYEISCKKMKILLKNTHHDYMSFGERMTFPSSRHSTTFPINQETLDKHIIDRELRTFIKRK